MPETAFLPATRRALVWMIAAALVSTFFFVGQALADDVQWNRQKRDCEFVLKAPDRYNLNSIEECAILWEQYKDVSGLSPDERKLFARGFSWLFVYGNSGQKALSKGALGRIGKPQPLCLVDKQWRDPNIGQSCAADAGDPGENAVARFPPARSVAIRKIPNNKVAQANRKAKEGIRLNSRKKSAAAVGKFEQALSLDPYNVSAKYNMACALSLLGDAEGAVEALGSLRSWDSSAAQAKFQKARSDADFEPIHNDAAFRRLVGLVRIQLLNGAGDPGLFHVGRIRQDLMSRNFYIAQYGFDRHTRRRPLVYYREGYEDQAKLAKDVVNNIRTALIKIYWDSPFDVIIVWGDPDVASQAGLTGPIVQGEEVKDKGNAAKEFLDKFNEAKKTGEDLNKAATDAPDLPR